MTNPDTPNGQPGTPEVPKSFANVTSELQRIVMMVAGSLAKTRGKSEPDNSIILDAMIEVLYGEGKITDFWKGRLAEHFPEQAGGLETFFEVQMKLNGKTKEALKIAKMFADNERQDIVS